MVTAVTTIAVMTTMEPRAAYMIATRVNSRPSERNSSLVLVPINIRLWYLRLIANITRVMPMPISTHEPSRARTTTPNTSNTAAVGSNTQLVNDWTLRPSKGCLLIGVKMIRLWTQRLKPKTNKARPIDAHAGITTPLSCA